jgi:hypothetical protein
MPSFNDAVTSLDQYYDSIIDLKENLQKHMNSNLPKSQKDEIQGLIEKQLEALERFKRNALEDLVTFPPHKVKHFPALPTFLNDGAFDKSVFIMTKFPNDQNPQQIDTELKKVIQSVRDAISEQGYIPRLALDKRFHPGLWDNVEMYLLGCKRGVAIVENKYQDELNPNVTMEWGWMRGMDRDVLYLVENTFDKSRADLSGLIQDQFAWGNPEAAIKQAVKNWLPPA